MSLWNVQETGRPPSHSPPFPSSGDPSHICEKAVSQLPCSECEEPRKSNAILPLDIARSVVVVWFNGISGRCGQFRDIEKDCIAGPCFLGLKGSDREMCVGSFLRKKTAVFVVLLFVVFAASEQTKDEGARGSVVRLRFVGANGEARVEGENLRGCRGGRVM